MTGESFDNTCMDSNGGSAASTLLCEKSFCVKPTEKSWQVVH